LTTLGSNVSETVLTKELQRLVTAGPYRWVRHPLYSAGIALFLSIGLMAANGFILICAVVALIGVRLVVVPLEEAQLVLKFGNDYRLYQHRTGSLAPLLRGARTGRRAV
jgi:protein-S-isoprenylcysteine O-methyltransferase Ste14